MGIHYRNLDNETRRLMVAEIQSGSHYISPRLTTPGQLAWAGLLEEAATSHDDDWLANQLLSRGYLRTQESYVRNETEHTRRINQPQAAEQLAEGEFNRYYLRGLCLRASELGIDHLVVYRGKPVQNPRPESEVRIGTNIGTDVLLRELRRNDFVLIGEVLGIPGGPNSGITCMLS